MTDSTAVTRQPSRKKFLLGMVVGIVVGWAIAGGVASGWALVHQLTHGTRVRAVIGVYHATTLLDVSGAESESNEEYLRRKERTISLVSSPMILAQVASEPKVAQLSLLQGQSDLATYLEKRIQVRDLPESNFFFVEMKGRPSEADDMKVIVDQVTRVFFEYIKEENDKKFVVAISALRAEAEKTRQLIRSLEGDLQRMVAVQARSTDGEDNQQVTESIDIRILRKELELVWEIHNRLNERLLLLKIENRNPSRIVNLSSVDGAQVVEE